MSLVATLAKATQNVIAKFGMTVIIERRTQDGYDPQTGMSTSGTKYTNAKAVIGSYMKKNPDGTMAQGDMKLQFDSTADIQTGDIVTVGSNKVTITDIKDQTMQNGTVGYEARGVR